MKVEFLIGPKAVTLEGEPDEILVSYKQQASDFLKSQKLLPAQFEMVLGLAVIDASAHIIMRQTIARHLIMARTELNKRKAE